MTDALIAVDGGNSKTDLALLREDGTLLAAVRGPGSNPHRHGLDSALDVLGSLVAAAWADAGLGLPPQSGGAAAAVGAFFMAGADQPEEERGMDEAIARRGWARRRLVANDTFALLWAGSTRGWGVAVVTGAGINAVGRSPSGATARFASLGAITGDWGGGPDIGLAALAAAVRAEDGRGPATVLTASVAAHFGLSSGLEVALAVHQRRIEYARLGELAARVTEADTAGDRAAGLILDRQADEVVTMAGAALRRVDLATSPVEVVVGGTVITSTPRLVDRLRERLAAVAPDASLVVCRSRPLVGAAVAALSLAGAGPAAQQRLRGEIDEERIRVAVPS